MVIRPGNKRLGEDWSRRDCVRATVSTAAIPEPWRSATHEQREEIDGHRSACLCGAVTEYRTKTTVILTALNC